MVLLTAINQYFLRNDEGLPHSSLRSLCHALRKSQMLETKSQSCGQCLVVHPTGGWLFTRRGGELFPRKPLAKSGRRWWLHSTAQMATPIFSSDFGATIGPAAQLSFWPPWPLNKDVVNLPSYPFQIRLFSNLSHVKKKTLEKQEQIFLQLWQSERFSHWARPTLFSLVQSQTA